MKNGLALIFLLTCGTLWNPSAVAASEAVESRCFGRPAAGHLENGWRLPWSGENFGAYSSLAWILGRTYVHSRVHRVLLQAYAGLAKELPERHFIYGETGKREGGKFWPHVTHQNGLSVDFMVPLLDESGRPADFPRSAWNRFGYDLEFDAEGRAEGYRIDFEAMAEHLYQLQRAARREGIGIRLVIFAPELSQRLFKTRRGAYLAKHVRFFRRPARQRHDEHYHVDFLVPCS